MARKPIRREDINPSYDEVISELGNTISKLIVENSILKITIKKLEDYINSIDDQDHSHSRQSKEQDTKEF